MSAWRTVLSWNIPEFYNVGGARAKNVEISSILRTDYNKKISCWYRRKVYAPNVCLFGSQPTIDNGDVNKTKFLRPRPKQQDQDRDHRM